MRRFFEGHWLGHPLHPILVELPVALWPMALLWDVLTRLGYGGNALVRAAFVGVLLGLLSAIPAALAGIVDWSGVKQSNPAWRLGMLHLILNVSATGLALLSLVLRAGDLDATETASLPLLLMLAVTLLVALSSYLGGRLVYEYGISVARVTKDFWRRKAEAGGARTDGGEGA